MTGTTASAANANFESPMSVKKPTLPKNHFVAFLIVQSSFLESIIDTTDLSDTFVLLKLFKHQLHEHTRGYARGVPILMNREKMRKYF
jgi:hypothetical protein